MDEKHKDCIKDIIEQNEEIKDNIERLEKLRKADKKRNIILAIELCIFLMIILYSCSASLNQNTVVQPKDLHVVGDADNSTPNGVPTSDETIDDTPDDEQKDGLYTITVDRIDIGVNKDYSNEDTELFKALSEGKELTRGDAKNLYRQFNLQYNTYYIKSSENVYAKAYTDAGNSVDITEDLGLNDCEFTNVGGYDVAFVADDCNQGAEPYSDDIIGYLMWKDYPDEDHCKEGASFVFIYDSKDINTDMIAQTVVEELNNENIPVGANRVSLEMYGAEQSNSIVDSYFFLSDIKPIIDSEFGTSEFYIGDDYGGSEKGFAHLAEGDTSNSHSRAIGFKEMDCTVTADDETPNIYAVIVNVDGFAAESIFTSKNTGSLESDIISAESEGYHK